MSIPGGHNPYSQPDQPRPDPNNPYARPQPANYGYPQPPGGGGFGPMTPPQAAPPSSGGSRGLAGWLGAALGIVVASAVWGTVLVFTSGGKEPAKEPTRPQPNLAGYAYDGNMCETADTSPFDEDYRRNDFYEPSALASKNRALDRSSCVFYLNPAADDYYANWVDLTFDAIWHKRTSPRAEFAARYRSQEQYEDANHHYRVEPVDGLGDEAFITYRTTADNPSRLSSAVLAVRHGWFEYLLTWEGYIDPTDSLVSHLGQEEYVAEALRQATVATLAALREAGDDNGGAGGTGGDSGIHGEVDGNPDA